MGGIFLYIFYLFYVSIVTLMKKTNTDYLYDKQILKFVFRETVALSFPF